MKGDNFEPANISPAELEPIVALLRRLTYADWHAAEKVRMYANQSNRNAGRGMPRTLRDGFCECGRHLEPEGYCTICDA